MLDDILSCAGNSNYTISIGSCESSLVGVRQEEKYIEGLSPASKKNLNIDQSDEFILFSLVLLFSICDLKLLSNHRLV